MFVRCWFWLYKEVMCGNRLWYFKGYRVVIKVKQDFRDFNSIILYIQCRCFSNVYDNNFVRIFFILYIIKSLLRSVFFLNVVYINNNLVIIEKFDF